MSRYNDRETLSTFRFGNRAKSIKNAVKQNAQRSAKELLMCLNVSEAKEKALKQLVKKIQSKVKSIVAGSDQEAALKPICDAKDTDLLGKMLDG